MSNGEATLLTSLDPRDRVAVTQRCTRLRYERGAYLFHAGEAGDALHFILKGRVSILAGVGGDPVILAIMGKGEVVGEQALLSDAGLRTATAKALEPTETMRLRKAEFDELRRQNPAIERLLVNILAGQVRRLTNQVHELVNVPATTRIYRRLVDLAELYEVAHDGGDIPVTQDQVASMAGVRLRITNRVLNDAKAAGLVSTANRRITVENWDELRRRARVDALPAW